jgi:PAS domain-containing protein
MNDHEFHPKDKTVGDDGGGRNPEITPEESPQDSLPLNRQFDEQPEEREAQLMKSLIKYEKLLDEIEDSVGEVDLHGKITFVNNASCKIWGRSKEQLIGLTRKAYADRLNQRMC